jgi:enoyl-CoA hydratase/carnithine racemase
MSYSTLTYDVSDRIGVMTFTQPERLNALSEARLAEIEAVLDAVEADEDLGALILTGSGKAFCVGLDLDLLDRAFGDIAYFEATVRRLSVIIERIEALDIPTIAAINGYARAGGFEITLGCDFCIIADEAKIGDAHTDAGVVPACVTLRLKRRIGDQRAKAVAIGLALKSVPLADLLDEARAFAATITDKPRPTIAAVKRVFIDGDGLGVKEGTKLELAAFVHYMSTEPYGREGYRAFREKRAPSWKKAG